MQTFFLLGKYSADSIKEASADRTEEVVEMVAKLGGKVKSMYALLGGYDLAIIVDFPKLAVAMKASVGLTVLTGISFTSLPAVPVSDFDKML